MFVMGKDKSTFKEGLLDYSWLVTTWQGVHVGFSWRHVRHIGLPKQWNGDHVVLDHLQGRRDVTCKPAMN